MRERKAASANEAEKRSATRAKFSRFDASGMITEETEGIVWGAKRESPYAAILSGLIEASRANPKAVLRFNTRSAYSSLNSRAKKMGLVLEFGTGDGGSMWVRIKSCFRTPEAKQALRDNILKLIAKTPCNPIYIATRMRGEGFDLDAATAGTILSQLAAEGKVTKRSDKTWVAN